MPEILHLYKRGCDFHPNYPASELPENREIGNFRVFGRFINEHGRETIGDFLLNRLWHGPRHSSAFCYLGYDLQADCCTYHFPFSTQDLPYAFSGILTAVNRVSPVQYDSIEIHDRAELPTK